MRAFSSVPLAMATLLVAGGSACVLAPPPLEGAPAGSACAADLECADGLVCACGTCAEPSADDAPSCEVEIDDRCGDSPSNCYAACGDFTVVGLADCVDGRESCDAAGGVLFDSCPAETCWGDPAPGEICVDGAFECEVGRSPYEPFGCYTFDCPADEIELCVTSCESGTPFAQVCIASEWRCETGFPVRQCGGCVPAGNPPDCFDSCADMTFLDEARCSDNTWSCEHIANAVIETMCMMDGGTPDDAGATDAGRLDGGLTDGGVGADSGVADAGTDGGVLDAGTDGGVADGGMSMMPDSGTLADGGSLDAGAADAGAGDAGTSDAGTSDGG